MYPTFYILILVLIGVGGTLLGLAALGSVAYYVRAMGRSILRHLSLQEYSSFEDPPPVVSPQSNGNSEAASEPEIPPTR